MSAATARILERTAENWVQLHLDMARVHCGQLTPLAVTKPLVSVAPGGVAVCGAKRKSQKVS